MRKEALSNSLSLSGFSVPKHGKKDSTGTEDEPYEHTVSRVPSDGKATESPDSISLPRILPSALCNGNGNSNGPHGANHNVFSHSSRLLQFSPGPDQVRTITRRPSELSDVGNASPSLTAIQLRTLADSDVKFIATTLERREPLDLKKKIHTVCLLVLFVVSILNTVFPATRMQELVSLAPTINQAGRRIVLANSCSHLCRELVIDDGYARMAKEDVASALRYYLDELRLVDHAVRHGGSRKVEEGTESRGDEVGRLMYGDGCPWRDDPSECSTPSRPGAAQYGLHNLMEHFTAAAEEVLANYGPGEGYTKDFLTNPRPEEEVWAADVWAWVDPGSKLQEDRSVRFVLETFDGDLFQGLSLVVHLFDQDSLAIIGHAHSDNRLFFILYVLLLLGFYGVFFRRAMRHARDRHRQGCQFASRIPSSTLSALEVQTVRRFLTSEALLEALPKCRWLPIHSFVGGCGSAMSKDAVMTARPSARMQGVASRAPIAGVLARSPLPGTSPVPT